MLLFLSEEKSARAYYLLGQLYYEKGQFAHTISAYKKALVINPQYVDASISLSVLYNDLGHYEEGGAIFNRALRAVEFHKKGEDPFLNEKISAKHMELGYLYKQYLRYDEAMAQFQIASDLKPDFEEARLNIAQCLFQQGKKKEALDELKRLKKEFPSFLPGRIALGLMQYSMGHVLYAVEEWERVLEKAPEDAKVQAYLKMARETNTTAL